MLSSDIGSTILVALQILTTSMEWSGGSVISINKENVPAVQQKKTEHQEIIREEGKRRN